MLAQRTNLGRTSVRFAKLIKLDRGKERKNTSRGASEGAPTFNFVLLTERCYYVETVHCAELLSSAPAYSSLSSAGSLSRPWLTSILLPPPSHLSYGCVLTISPQVVKTLPRVRLHNSRRLLVPFQNSKSTGLLPHISSVRCILCFQLRAPMWCPT